MPAASLEPAGIHARLIKSASQNRALYNKLITLYSHNPSTLPSALLLFRRLPFPPSAVSWTSIISAHRNHPSSALSLLVSMLRRPALPTDATLSSLLKTLSSSPRLPHHLQLHCLSLKLSLHRLSHTGAALVHFYSKSRLPSHALAAFHDIDEAHRDEVCYGAAVSALAQNAHHSSALTLFASLRSAAIPSNTYTVSSALRSSAQAAALEQTRLLHAHSLIVGLCSDIVVGTALVDAYGKSGLVVDARGVFDELSAEANLVTYNSMLAGYAQQGDVKATTELFDEMLERKEFAPDEYSFLGVLTACSNAGLVQEAEQWLDWMRSRYGVEPLREHYSCLVGALARVGRLADAERFALAMPFRADAAVWRTLLSGCMVHRAVELGRVVGQRLLELDPYDDSAYVILGNIYSESGRMEEMAGLWKEMRDRGVKKEGGRSWVEVRGEVHVFVSGDRKHERRSDIYAKLMELVVEVRRLGYEDANERVWEHSERLAAAFAVVSGAVPEGKALRVVKNLRICGDCHEFFKYLSLVLVREIVVRDVNRYHRIQDGGCTCGDYW